MGKARGAAGGIRAGLAKVLGVYSPVGRCLKTSFALTMGKLLAQEERVLYPNLEEFFRSVGFDERRI